MKEVDYTFENCNVICDYCDREERIESTDYSTINKELKENGWVIKKIGDDWYEFCCVECYRKFMEE